MERANENNISLAARYIACTPQQLRMIADRLESTANSSTSKEKITYPVTKDTILYYDPSMDPKGNKQEKV